MKTLKINLPLGQVLLQSLFWLFLFCAAIELFARTPIASAIFRYQSYGSSHPHFETQILRLKDREAQLGHIDCIFIGNSQVLYGIDPSVVEQAYLEKTGKPIHCQNFGLGGLTPISAGPLARVLIKNFHPSVIVFGTGLLDYSESSMEGTDVSIMSSAWVQYQLGKFSIDGWLFENSSAFRYIFGVDRFLKNEVENQTQIDTDGHAIFKDQSGMTIAQQMDYFDTVLEKLELTDKQINGLRDLLSINASGVKVIVIESPANPEMYKSKRKARLLYPYFKSMLTTQADLGGSDVWMTQDYVNIPPEDWYDIVHLNENGSKFFSRLVGNYLATVIPAPTHTSP
jgi:hypothetical protein